MRFSAKTMCWEEENWRRVFAFCALWWGQIGLSSYDCQQNFLFSSLSQVQVNSNLCTVFQMRQARRLSNPCIQRYTSRTGECSTYVGSHANVPSQWRAWTCSLLTADRRKKVELTKLPFAVVITDFVNTNANYFTIVTKLNMDIKEKDNKTLLIKRNIKLDSKTLLSCCKFNFTLLTSKCTFVLIIYANPVLLSFYRAL